MQLTTRQQAGFAALRVSLGLLLVWWGLGRINAPGMGVKMQEMFYFGLFPSPSLQYGFGFLEVTVGLLVMIGLFKRIAVPAQLMITGFSAITILPALMDPFALWLPFDKMAPVQHLFYPSVIALTGGVMMYLMSEHDRFSADNWLKGRHDTKGPIPAE